MKINSIKSCSYRWLVFFLLSALLLVLGASTVLISSEFTSSIDNVKNIDYAIILGAGLEEDKVSPRLKRRLDGAYIFLKESDIPIIVSGGKGPDELIAEAEAMKRYLVSKGVAKHRIILEDQSTSTQENIFFSNQKILVKHPKVVIFTSDYHMYRSKMLARRIGWIIEGVAVKSSKQHLLKRVSREILALIKDIMIRTY